MFQMKVHGQLVMQENVLKKEDLKSRMPEVEELKVNCFVHPVYLHVKMRRNGLL
jgi:hypothetical protein